MTLKDKIRYLVLKLAENLHKRKRTVLALSCFVVFVTTYLLILPAFTLEKEKAAEQGGITVPVSVEDASDQSDDTDEISSEADDLSDPSEDESADAKDNSRGTGSKDVVSSSNMEDAAESSGSEADDKSVADDSTEDSKDTGSDAGQLTFEGEGYSIEILDDKSVLPADTEVSASELDPQSSDKTERKTYEKFYDEALQTLKDEKAATDDTEVSFARLYDISLLSGGETIEPDDTVGVRISYDQEERKDLKVEDEHDLHIVHITEDKNGKLKSEIIDKDDVDVTLTKNNRVKETEFQTDGFSVYAIVYTVDFHYEVNGKMYDFSLPGGGFVSLKDLVEVLGIAGTTNGGQNANDDTALTLGNVEVSEDTEKFVADVEKVEFSSPELVWVGKVNNETTVGALKEKNGLDVEYSAELTEEQIAEINAQTVEAGDWALISLKAFDTEETLTVTMKNGDVFTIQVTDGQISTHVITADGEDYIITVTYGPEAGIPDGATLEAKEILEGTEEYATMLEQSMEALRDNEDVDVEIYFSRFFDVSILDKEENIIEPESPVSVSVKYFKAIDMNNAKPSIVHFAEDGIEVIEANGCLEGDGLEGTINVFEYEQGSFSGIGTIVNSSTIADGKYFMLHSTGGKQYALTTSGGTVEVDYNSSKKTVTAKNGTDESTLLWNIKHIGNGYYSLQGDNGKYVVLGENGVIVGDSMEYIYPLWYGYDPYTGSNGDGYAFYNVVTYDESTWIPLSFTNDLEYTTGGTATRVRLAKYSMDSAPTGQPPTVNTYTGHPVDPKEVNDWLMSLFDDMPIGRTDGYSKTAEVYDYENRIYSVDLTAKSNSQGVMSNLDIAFSVDMSNSMLFPKAMTEIGTVDMNQNAVATMLKGRENEVFFVVSDIPNTYTVNAIFYDKGSKKWKYEDASKWARHQSNNSTVIPDSTTRISTIKDSNDNYVDTGTYTLYKAEGDYVDYVVNYKGDVWENPDNRLSEMKTSLSIAFNFLNEMSNKYKVRIRVGWNGFARAVSYDNGKSGNDSEKFNYSAGNGGNGQSLTDLSNVNWTDIVAGFSDAGNQTGGGTRPDAAFDDARNNMGWDYSSNTKRVLVLITDGAPQGGYKTGTTQAPTTAEALQYAKDAADKLNNIDIVSIGLSTEHIDSADKLFQYISASDADGQKLVYQAKDGDVLRDALMDTLRQMVEQAITVGTVKDTIDPAFYPVSTDGTPLNVNDKIDLNGKLTTDTSKPYGVIGWDNVNKCWTVTWSEQDIVWPDENHPYGWHGRVLIKAKENFLGGNEISTNKGDASLDVIDAKVKTTQNADGSWNYKRVPFSTLVDLEDSQLETRYMDTPYVNVDELEMTKNDTEWTVYLETEVDPGEQMKKLFENIRVMKVVTDGQHEMIVQNGQTAQDVMVYNLIPKENQEYSFDEASSDTRDKRNVDQAYFYLSDLFDNMKDSLGNDFIVDNMTSDQAIAKLLAGETVEVTYQGYGHANVGKIILTLKPDPESKKNDLSNHATDQVGTFVEKYILSAEYKPEPSTHTQDWFWNTGSFGTKDRGKDAEDKTKYNTHTINVFKRIVNINKLNANGDPLDGATFEIYKDGTLIDTLTAGTATWDYVVPDVDQKVAGEYWKDTTTYIIQEKEAPSGYAKYDGDIPISLNISDTKTDLPSREGYVLCNWTQRASVSASEVQDYVSVDANSDENITISVKNDKSVDITVIKQDTDSKEIAGAKFSITKGSSLVTDIKVVKKGGTWENEADRINVENGVFTVPEGGVTILDLGAGEYTLEETEPPAGYIKTVKPIKFSADRSGTVTYTNAADNPDPKVVAVDSNKQYTVQNEPGAALPNTGGSGTNLFYILGSVLVLGTGLMLWRRRRTI